MSVFGKRRLHKYFYWPDLDQFPLVYAIFLFDKTLDKLLKIIKIGQKEGQMDCDNTVDVVLC